MTHFNFYAQEWLSLKGVLSQQRTELVERLIKADDAETRGKIKMIDSILSLETETTIKVEINNY